jgi:hypothetical protein
MYDNNDTHITRAMGASFYRNVQGVSQTPLLPCYVFLLDSRPRQQQQGMHRGVGHQFASHRPCLFLLTHQRSLKRTALRAE